MPIIASRVIEISFLTLCDRFFGEVLIIMCSNDLEITFPFSLSAFILKPLFEASQLILVDEL